MKRQAASDESVFREKVVEAANQYPFFRVHVGASNRELLEMPIEVLVDRIIGDNIFVFASLVRSNKALGELLENIPGIYRNLFYHTFVNERVLMHDMLHHKHRFGQYSMLIDLFHASYSQCETYMGKLGVLSIDMDAMKAVSLDVLDRGLDMCLQSGMVFIEMPGGLAHHNSEFFFDGQVLDRCRKDIGFAQKFAQYYNLVNGAGFAHAAYLSTEQYQLRCHTLDALYELFACHFTLYEGDRAATPIPRRNRLYEDVDSDSDSEDYPALILYKLGKTNRLIDAPLVYEKFLDALLARVRENRVTLNKVMMNVNWDVDMPMIGFIESFDPKKVPDLLPFDSEFIHDVLVKEVLPHLFQYEKFQKAAINRVRDLITRIKLDIDRTDKSRPWQYYHTTMDIRTFTDSLEDYVNEEKKKNSKPLEEKISDVDDEIEGLQYTLKELIASDVNVASLECIVTQLNNAKIVIHGALKREEDERTQRITDINRSNHYFKRLFHETIKQYHTKTDPISDNDYFYLKGMCAACFTKKACFQEPGLTGHLFCSTECQFGFHHK